MWFVICHGIVIMFEIFALALLTVWLIGMIVHGNTPRWFSVIFDLFFGMEDGDD